MVTEPTIRLWQTMVSQEQVAKIGLSVQKWEKRCPDRTNPSKMPSVLTNIGSASGRARGRV